MPRPPIDEQIVPISPRLSQRVIETVSGSTAYLFFAVVTAFVQKQLLRTCNRPKARSGFAAYPFPRDGSLMGGLNQRPEIFAWNEAASLPVPYPDCCALFVVETVSFFSRRFQQPSRSIDEITGPSHFRKVRDHLPRCRAVVIVDVDPLTRPNPRCRLAWTGR
jgi:hypothetical protein